MELSESTVKGLSLLNDVDLIPDDILPAFLRFTARSLLDDETIGDSDADAKDELDTTRFANGVLKEASAALSTLFLEAAKHDLTSTELSDALDEEDDVEDEVVVGSRRAYLNDERRESVVKKYEALKPRLRGNLASIGRHFPLVADAEWKLECVVRDNFVDRRGELRFVVTLRGRDGEEGGQTDVGQEDIRFACTVEQLQDLVAKLKNACKGLERIVQ